MHAEIISLYGDAGDIQTILCLGLIRFKYLFDETDTIYNYIIFKITVFYTNFN